MIVVQGVIRFYQAKGDFGFLSNLFKCTVVFDSKEFQSAECAYQYGKFRDKAAAEWAIQAPSSHLVAIVAHGLFKWDIADGWAESKVDRMRRVLLAKFEQNPKLALRLVETRDAVLIEASKTDAFWGMGAKENGQNMLGKLLVETRTKLKAKAGQ